MLQALAEKFNFSELPFVNEVLEILLRNTTGKIWMLGGGVFRQLNNKHWGTNFPYRDLDFLAEETSKDLWLPSGWANFGNSYGSYKLRYRDFEMDLWSKEQQHSIVSRNLEFCIENVLKFTPLNVQSIAYDFQTQKVIGDTGLQAILDKIVKVNCQEQVEHYCGLKKITVQSFVEQKAAALGFTPVHSMPV